MCSIVLLLSLYFRNINRNRLFVETTSIPHNHNVTTEQGNKRQNIYKYLDRPFRVSSLRVYGWIYRLSGIRINSDEENRNGGCGC